MARELEEARERVKLAENAIIDARKELQDYIDDPREVTINDQSVNAAKDELDRYIKRFGVL
jgi:hypothetical protein